MSAYIDGEMIIFYFAAFLECVEWHGIFSSFKKFKILKIENVTKNLKNIFKISKIFSNFQKYFQMFCLQFQKRNF